MIKQVKVKKNLIIKLAIVAFGIYLLYSLISVQSQINERRNELNKLRQQYSEMLIRNEELQKTVDSYGTDEFIERQARGQLGYAYSDEHFYVDISGTD